MLWNASKAFHEILVRPEGYPFSGVAGCDQIQPGGFNNLRLTVPYIPTHPQHQIIFALITKSSEWIRRI
jgi:hypothetical protein